MRKLTDRDRDLVMSVLEVVAEQVARGGGRPGILYRIKDEMIGRWNGVDVDVVIKAMEKGWDKGRGW